MAKNVRSYCLNKRFYNVEQLAMAQELENQIEEAPENNQYFKRYQIAAHPDSYKHI